MSHTLFLVDPEVKQLEPLKVWEPETEIEEEAKPAAKPGIPSTMLQSLLCSIEPAILLSLCTDFELTHVLMCCSTQAGGRQAEGRGGCRI